jgi:phosphatidylserine decarboxylase
MTKAVLTGGLLALITASSLLWKWRLGLRRALPVVVGLVLLSGLTVALLGRATTISAITGAGLVWFLTLAGGLAILAFCFHRDPERTPPEKDGVIVSPADGEVLYVHESRAGMLPIATKQGRYYTLRELTKTPLRNEEALVLGIGMSFLDVHVNRAPIAGRIALQRRFPGSFGSLRLPEMIFENQRVTTLIEQGDLQVALVQIASRLVRRIVSYVREGQEVTIGQRIGMIRFGSQVDLVLPARENLQVMVQPGERVYAGQSIIAVLSHMDTSIARPPTAGETAEDRLSHGQLLTTGN